MKGEMSPERRFAFERARLEEEKAAVERELKALEESLRLTSSPPPLSKPLPVFPSFGKKKLSNAQAPADDSLGLVPRLPPLLIPMSQSQLGKQLALLHHPHRHPGITSLDSSDSDSDDGSSDLPVTSKNLIKTRKMSVGGSTELAEVSPTTATVIREITAMRMAYLQSGGSNPVILEQMNQLESRALAGLTPAAAANALATSIEAKDQEPLQQQQQQQQRPITFEEIDMIQIPPYDEYRGFSLFVDMVNGIPYFGGGSSVPMDVYFTVFNGAGACCPVDTVRATCVRQPVTFVGKSMVKEVQRYYDIHPTLNHRLFFQFSLTDSSDLRPDAEIRPIAWTSFDLFKEDGSLNHGRWRLSLFYPPVDFRVTTYNLYSNHSIIPNMFLYIRVVHPMLQAHHKRIDLSKLDFRNTTSGAEYLVFKPAYNNFEFYDAVQLSLTMEKRSMSSVLADSRNSLAGARAGARLGSTNTLNMGQVLHCNLGFRIEQLKNLDVEPNTQIKVRIRIGDQVNPWVSGVAEIGFEKRNYGWPDDIAEIIFNDLPIISGTVATVELVGSVGDEPDRVITLKPVTMDLFQNLEDKSIVVNEGLFTPTAQIINTEAPCEFSIRIFSDARVPAPFLFDSKRLDKPLPAGAWYKVDRDPSMQCTNVLEGGGLPSFKFSIDGARFLPENCTICRIQCQLMHRDQSLFDATQEPIDLIPDLDSPTYFPTYTNSVTIKLPSLASAIDATLTIVMKIFTIDRHTRQLLTVGIALFNVFLADVEDSIDGSRVQPSSPTTRPIFLNEGYHQIPVYMWTTRMGFKDTGVHVNAVKSQRVPCCSILMRLSGRDDLPPKLYQDRVYNSMQCIPLPYEMGLFYFLMKERGLQPTIRTALQQLKEEVRAANDDALIGWMGRRVSKEKGIIPSMELSCILKYHEGWGFKIAVDMAENLRNKAFSIAIVSLSPPGSLYYSKRKSLTNMTLEDVMYNQKLDFSTTVRSPQWKDGFMWYQKYPFNSRLIAVIDIRCLGYSDQEKQYKLQSQGWTLFNVFHEAGFVKHGVFQLPLFDGLPTPELLDQLSRSETDVDELIVQLVKSKKIRYVKRYGTVYIRICDGRRERELPFVKSEAISKNIVIGKGLFEFDDSQPFVKLLPKGVTEEEYQARCLGTLIELSGLPKPMRPRE